MSLPKPEKVLKVPVPATSYSDAFWIIAIGLIVSLAAIPLLKNPQRAFGPIEGH